MPPSTAGLPPGPYHVDDLVTLYGGDCLDVLRSLPDCSIDAVVCDPPYGLSDIKPDAVVAALTAWAQGDREHVPDSRGFMGRSWDAFVPPPAVWDECLRVLRPGGHLLAFAGSRTADLMGLSVRMAGFEIRDTISWMYGSGFPKGQNIGKAIDKMAGAEREAVGPNPNHRAVSGVGYEGIYQGGNTGSATITAPATPEAARWEGWNTSLRPAQEPIIVARKPFKGSVAANVLEHGTGALNIDATRVPHGADVDLTTVQRQQQGEDNGWRLAKSMVGTEVAMYKPGGRWPANVVLSHVPSECGGDACESGCVPGCPVAELDRQSGITKDGVAVQRNRKGAKPASVYGTFQTTTDDQGYGGQGGASRYFPVFRYQAKAPAAERPKVNGVAHVSVKPLTLMRWLAKLVTRQGGTILDPFSGSGTTLEAGMLEGFHVIGVERQPEYLPLIEQRIERAHAALAARAEQEAKAAEPTTGTLFDVA